MLKRIRAYAYEFICANGNLYNIYLLYVIAVYKCDFGVAASAGFYVLSRFNARAS